MREITGAELREYEPHASGVAALHVPTTGITDYKVVSAKYAERIQQAGGTVLGLELVIFDGTTLDLFPCPELAQEFGVPRLGTRPVLRAVALLQAGTMRWKAAALGGYHDGENALADQLQGALGPGQLCLADRYRMQRDQKARDEQSALRRAQEENQRLNNELLRRELTPRSGSGSVSTVADVQAWPDFAAWHVENRWFGADRARTRPKDGVC